MRKLISGKNILKEAGVLLVVAILVLTAIFVLTPITMMTKAQTPVWSEDFSGVTPPMLPTGWSTTHPENWKTSDTSSAGGASPEARFQYYPSSSGTFRLFTNLGDLSGCSNCYLEFKHYVNHYSGAYTLKVETSIDGINWNPTPMWQISPSGSGGGPVTIGPFTGTNPFYLSWTFEGYSWNINYWHIDDIEITCGPLNNPPNMPNTETPVNGATGIPACSTNCLYWYGGDPDPSDTVTYQVNLWPAGGTPSTICTFTDPAIVINQQCCALGGLWLVSGTTYFWQVIATDNHGATTVGPVWSFTTAPCDLYIRSITISGSRNNKINVDIGNLNGPVNSVKVEMIFTVTDVPCSYGTGSLVLTPGSGGSTTSAHPVYTATWTRTIPPPGQDFEVEVSGCACFDLVVKVDACGTSADCNIEETRQGRICDLSLW